MKKVRYHSTKNVRCRSNDQNKKIVNITNLIQPVKLLFAFALLTTNIALATVPEIQPGFKRIPTQFIAAHADPDE